MRALRWVLCAFLGAAGLAVDLPASFVAGQPTIASAQARRHHKRRHHKRRRHRPRRGRR
jgi:hypothetical protein